MRRQADKDGGEIVTATLGIRNDKDSAYGADTTAQAGLEFRPSSNLLFRGAYSEAFKAPGLAQAFAAEQTNDLSIFISQDPRRPNDTVAGLASFKQLPLKAESGRSSNLGIVWEPVVGQGRELRTSVNAWKINVDNQIQFLFPDAILANESLFSNLVVRAPAQGTVPGSLLEVIYGYVNVAKFSVRGVDAAANMSFASPMGRLSLGAAVTRTLSFESALTPNAPLTSRLSVADTTGWRRVGKAISLLG